jgi:nucleoside-triphosphatase THEP1
MKELSIKISGSTASGKSRLLYFLKEYLRLNGFKVIHNPTKDFKNELGFDGSMGYMIDDAIEDISSSSIIHMTEESVVTNENYLDYLGDEYIERYLRRRKLKNIGKI